MSQQTAPHDYVATRMVTDDYGNEVAVPAKPITDDYGTEIEP